MTQPRTLAAFPATAVSGFVDRNPTPALGLPELSSVVGTGRFLKGVIAVFAVFAFLSACTPQSEAESARASSSTDLEASVKKENQLDYAPFELKPEPELPCQRADEIDANLGNSPEVFVQAAYCQITGKPATHEEVRKWTDKLRKGKQTRRIDVIYQLCIDTNRECKIVYSDPWVKQVELRGAPEKRVKRDIGAVLMFFFSCPQDVNCRTRWANTHVHGMADKHELYGFGDEEKDYYDPLKPGFWHRELLDAQWAGMSFLMPNVYGPDIEDGKLAPLQEALDAIQDPPKIAMFDDSWTWGEPWFSDFWKQKPDLSEPEVAAMTIYEAKWKPFFSQIDEKYWYRFKGKPFIYLYNAGKLNPRGNASEVFALMKAMFKADFGEEPFLMVDSAYFDDKRMDKVADARFRWFTFQQPGQRSRSELNGHIIDHAMVRWDSVGRETLEDETPRVAKAGDFLLKHGRVLERVLEDSKDAEILILATWNDLGEGTGVNRNYDYYVEGHWLAPHHFMKMIRDSQSGK